jgi:hypothetical protein
MISSSEISQNVCMQKRLLSNLSFEVYYYVSSDGAVGVSVYGGVTAISMSSFYLALRTGKADNMITNPLERILGKQSQVVQNIKRQLGEVSNDRPPASADHSFSNDIPSSNNKASDFSLAREWTYLGIATLLDSLVLPIKLAACLPIAKYILKRRGR